MSETVINLEEIQKKLYNQLSPSGWGNVLKSFMLSQDMLKILKQLIEESEEGKHWVPKLKQVFRAFVECPYDKLKLVMVLQSPYQFLLEGQTIADGIAMSCSNTKKLQPSLLYVHQEINDTVYPGEKYHYITDLARWSNQGVLLLNIALTTTVGKTESHYGLWKPFITYLMDMLNWNNGGLVWLFLGKVSQGYMGLLNEGHYKITCTHPAYAAHQKLEKWSSDGAFTQIQKLLKQHGKEEINWK